VGQMSKPERKAFHGIKRIERGKEVKTPQKNRAALIIIGAMLFIVLFLIFGLGLGTIVIMLIYVILAEATLHGKARQIRQKRTARRIKTCKLTRFARECLACPSYVIKEGRGYCMQKHIWLE